MRSSSLGTWLITSARCAFTATLFGFICVVPLISRASDTESFTYDNVPGVAMEYRVFVDGGKEDCYYQYVHPGSSLYVSFWVIRGGDGMAGFAVKDPAGKVVLPYEWKKEAEYEESASGGGYYEICIDNQFSRFASKLVNLYVTTFRYDQWEKYTADVEAIDANVANFTNTLQGVNIRIQNMLKYQQLGRSTESRDMSLLLANKAWESGSRKGKLTPVNVMMLQLGLSSEVIRQGTILQYAVAAGAGTALFYKLRNAYSGWSRKREILEKISRRRRSRRANFEAIKALSDPPQDVVALLEGKKPEKILELLGKGEVRCVDVLRFFQKKALAVTDRLNCITEFILEAEDWAHELDRVPPEKRGPLHGLPISVKENFDVVGYDSTFGLGKRLENPAAANAVSVDAVRALGGVPFCRTNVPQTMLSFGCGNPVYGLTGNPYDLNRTCGGSTGGEGSLLGAGGSCVGLGTDIGGSVRIPAHFSGCVGFKSTISRLPKKGIQRVTPGSIGVSGSVGILGTTAVIVAKFFKALWSTELLHKMDSVTCPLPFRSQAFSSAVGLKVGYYVDDGWFPPAPATRRALDVAREALKRCGHELVPINMSDFGPRLMKCYFDCVMADDFVTFRKSLEDEELDESISSNCFAAGFGRSCRMLVGYVTSFVSPIVGTILKCGMSKPVDLWMAVRNRQLLQEELLGIWKENGVDVVLCPASAIYSVPHRSISTLISAQSYCAVYNLLDFPAGVVPVTKVSKEDDLALDKYEGEVGSRDRLFRVAAEALRGGVGLPVGVQVVGRPYDDERVLSVLCQLEKALAKSDACLAVEE